MKAKGVTLVELLVAVTVFVLLMVTFYIVFKIGNKAYETGEKRVELIQNARVALDMMASQIRQALPQSEFEIYLKGSSTPVTPGNLGHTIVFYAPLDGVEGAEEIRFSQLNYSDVEKNLIYKRVKNPGQGYGDQEVTTEVLADLVTGGGIADSGITFHEAPRVSGLRTGLVTIKLILKKDPLDADSPEYPIQTKVKAARQYGLGLE